MRKTLIACMFGFGLISMIVVSLGQLPEITSLLEFDPDGAPQAISISGLCNTVGGLCSPSQFGSNLFAGDCDPCSYRVRPISFDNTLPPNCAAGAGAFATEDGCSACSTGEGTVVRTIDFSSGTGGSCTDEAGLATDFLSKTSQTFIDTITGLNQQECGSSSNTNQLSLEFLNEVITLYCVQPSPSPPATPSPTPSPAKEARPKKCGKKRRRCLQHRNPLKCCKKHCSCHGKRKKKKKRIKRCFNRCRRRLSC